MSVEDLKLYMEYMYFNLHVVQVQTSVHSRMKCRNCSHLNNCLFLVTMVILDGGWGCEIFLKEDPPPPKDHLNKV